MSISDQVISKELANQDEISHSRYRVRFGKHGPLRYCSHLDVMRVWERVFRRASVPLVYSQGFNPRPKLQIAAGLPLGYCSTCEILDVWLESNLPDLSAIVSRLNVVSPPGLSVEAVWSVELRAPALQTLTHLATYQVVLGAGQTERSALEKALDAMLAQSEIMRSRRGRAYDLRRLIKDILVVSENPLTLQMVLALSQQQGTGRPDEVLESLGLDPLSAHVTRTAIELDAVA